MLLSKETLDELFVYSPVDGTLTWRERPQDHFPTKAVSASWNARMSGRIAGRVVKNGYREVAYKKKIYQVHRIAWTIMTGNIPFQIDHINGNRLDNRFSNLRNVSGTDNARNHAISKANSSGVVGVTFRPKSGKWIAYIGVGSRQEQLGAFDDKELAIRARKDAEKLHGYHPNHGRQLSENMTRAALASTRGG